jgi:RNA 2',3'-cyclic 3'-phosphodiesterase
MRLFVAVPLPPEAQAAAAEILGRLRTEEWPVRWVREDGLHITLKFFGDVMPERYDTIAEMIGFAAEDMRPMTLSITGAGAFPGLAHPRVIRLDLAGDAAALELLQDRLERKGLGIGFPPEGRPFHPHVTLCRVKEGQRLPAGAQTTLAAVTGGEPFLADRVVLFESLASPLGPRYDPRMEITLTA